jgi:hypothetical protein
VILDLDLNAIAKDRGVLAGCPEAVLKHIQATGQIIAAYAALALAEAEPMLPSAPAVSPGPELDHFITEQEAAEMIGCKRSTLQARRLAKQSPYVEWAITRPGIRGVRYDPERIRQWKARVNRTPLIGRQR